MDGLIFCVQLYTTSPLSCCKFTEVEVVHVHGCNAGAGTAELDACPTARLLATNQEVPERAPSEQAQHKVEYGVY